MSRSDYAFAVCRIEPENNIHIILEAFAEQTALPLIIVGNWSQSSYGQDLFDRYQGFSHITLLNPIYDKNALNKLRTACRLYIHGHSCGGTNPSLVEAMYLHLPIAAFDVNFNRETTQNSALYFADAGELQKIISDIDKLNLAEIADRMKEIADKQYTWTRIAECYAALF
jgi:glycosyltransferase involved in cell wall biosynthesis